MHLTNRSADHLCCLPKAVAGSSVAAQLGWLEPSTTELCPRHYQDCGLNGLMWGDLGDTPTLHSLQWADAGLVAEQSIRYEMHGTASGLVV